MAANEFALGPFILLTHPERLFSESALMIDCPGDEYSFRGDYTFDRVPLFDYDSAVIEFSVFCKDRARDLWGNPSGFLFKMTELRPFHATRAAAPGVELALRPPSFADCCV